MVADVALSSELRMFDRPILVLAGEFSSMFFYHKDPDISFEM